MITASKMHHMYSKCLKSYHKNMHNVHKSSNLHMYPFFFLENYCNFVQMSFRSSVVHVCVHCLILYAKSDHESQKCKKMILPVTHSIYLLKQSVAHKYKKTTWNCYNSTNYSIHVLFIQNIVGQNIIVKTRLEFKWRSRGSVCHVTE